MKNITSSSLMKILCSYCITALCTNSETNLTPLYLFFGIRGLHAAQERNPWQKKKSFCQWTAHILEYTGQ